MASSPRQVPSIGGQGLHLGVQLGTSRTTWPELREAARLVEELGYDSLWVPDHLTAREENAPRLEAWQVLGAFAAVTSKVRLGTLVSAVAFRHPAIVAKAAATLDHMSGGRVIVGLGAGGMAEEHRRFGLPFGTSAERGLRLEEYATVIRALLDAPTTTFRGAFYELTDAVAEPKPLQAHLPLLVAGGGDDALRVAARHADMWNAILRPAAFADALARLRVPVAEAGRANDDVLATASFRVIVRERSEGIAARIADLAPEWHVDPYRVVGSADEVAFTLLEYLRAGAGGLIVQMPAPFDRETLERLARDVQPRLVAEK